jgi:hypothetical protein
MAERATESKRMRPDRLIGLDLAQRREAILRAALFQADRLRHAVAIQAINELEREYVSRDRRQNIKALRMGM